MTRCMQRLDGNLPSDLKLLAVFGSLGHRIAVLSAYDRQTAEALELLEQRSAGWMHRMEIRPVTISLLPPA